MTAIDLGALSGNALRSFFNRTVEAAPIVRIRLNGYSLLVTFSRVISSPSPPSVITLDVNMLVDFTVRVFRIEVDSREVLILPE